jgi:hypothetical protein
MGIPGDRLIPLRMEQCSRTLFVRPAKAYFCRPPLLEIVWSEKGHATSIRVSRPSRAFTFDLFFFSPLSGSQGGTVSITGHSLDSTYKRASGAPTLYVLRKNGIVLVSYLLTVWAQPPSLNMLLLIQHDVQALKLLQIDESNVSMRRFGIEIGPRAATSSLSC